MAKHFLDTPVVYKLGTRCIRYIPTFISYAFTRAIADISYFFYKTAAKKIHANFRLVFPDAADEELSRRTRKVFRNYAEYLVDYARFADLDRETLLEKIVHFKGEENLIEALNMRKGLILLTAHLGNWELGGIFFAAYGLNVNVLTLPDENAGIDMSRIEYRKRYGVKTITVGNSPLSAIEMIKALNDNEVVAMLIDRYTEDRDGVKVNFFNKPAMFPKGPFVLSRITGVPVVAAFVVKEHGEYIGIVEKPFIVANEEEEQKSLEKVVRIFERHVVNYADQWYDFR